MGSLQMFILNRAMRKHLGLMCLPSMSEVLMPIWLKKQKEYTLGGPYELKQGGMGALLLNPVYQSDEGEDGTFWGFVITVIDWDRFISELKLEKLSEASFYYKIWTKDKSTGEHIVLAQNKEKLSKDCLTLECSIPNEVWYFDIEPSAGWITISYWFSIILTILVLSMLIAAIFYQVISKNNQEKQYAEQLQRAAETRQKMQMNQDEIFI